MYASGRPGCLSRVEGWVGGTCVARLLRQPPVYLLLQILQPSWPLIAASLVALGMRDSMLRFPQREETDKINLISWRYQFSLSAELNRFLPLPDSAQKFIDQAAGLPRRAVVPIRHSSDVICTISHSSNWKYFGLYEPLSCVMAIKIRS